MGSAGLMMEWLVGKQAKYINRTLTGIALCAYLVELGVGIFGGAHAAFWHIIRPGYVRIHAFNRIGGMDEYVKPWVADLHHWMVGIFIACVIPLIPVGIASKIAKRRASQH